MTIIKKLYNVIKLDYFYISYIVGNNIIYQQINEALCVNIVFIVNLQEITGIKWFGVLNASEIL